MNRTRTVMTQVIPGLLGMALAGTLLIGASPSIAAQGQAPAGAPGAPQVQVPTTTHLEPGDGTKANYRAKEQFVGISFFSDAIGESTAVTGMMTVNPDGSIAPGSKFDFDLHTLKSNEDLRDNYVRTRVLEVDKFPPVEFVPKSVTGLPHPLPAGGVSAFQLTGDLTIHGVTKEVTWSGITTFRPDLLSGRASTDITFAMFGLMKPTIPRLLGVQDNITLELVFRMKRS